MSAAVDELAYTGGWTRGRHGILSPDQPRPTDAATERAERAARAAKRRADREWKRAVSAVSVDGKVDVFALNAELSADWEWWR